MFEAGGSESVVERLAIIDPAPQSQQYAGGKSVTCSDAIDDTREGSRHVARVHEVVKAKATKTYPAGTALVVHVDDAIAFRDTSGVAALRQLAVDVLVPLLSGRE